MFKAPLRIDFAGGWSDVPALIKGMSGYVCNAAISPLIELDRSFYNFKEYPRACGLSTSTAVTALNNMGRLLNENSSHVAETLYQLENESLTWSIGRQDAYSIANGGVSCYEFNQDYAKNIGITFSQKTLDIFHKRLLLLFYGESRDAQTVVEQVYERKDSKEGRKAIQELANYGILFAKELRNLRLRLCGEIVSKNFKAQKLLAKATSNEKIEEIFKCAVKNGSFGGKICGAGGGGALLFMCYDPYKTFDLINKEFPSCKKIEFKFEFNNLQKINRNY